MITYYFLRKGEPKQEEPINKYSDVFSKVGVEKVKTVTYDKIRSGEHSFAILPELLDETENIVLLIPAILDTFNSMAYDGVEYAMRLYFKYTSMRKENFRLVILGSEDESAFWRHCKYSNLLKCPHVDYTYNNAFSIKEFLQKISQNGSEEWLMNWIVCTETIKRLNVEPPASYKSHHSITNEWSIYRWSKFIGIKNVDIQKEIDDFLYFNYLKAIYSETDIVFSHDLKVKGKGKVLLIDDEIGKGWNSFFESLCEQPSFKSIGSEFKKMSRDEIISTSEQTVASFEPDVVILDLRLHDDDYDEKDPLKLSGAEVFNKIKAINKGVQIVIFSASNKVWNYLPLPFDGVVLKESPEQSVKADYTYECLNNLQKTIEKGIERGQWLTKVYEKVKRIKDLVSSSKCFGGKTEEMLSGLDIAFDLLTKSDEEVEYRSYSYLQLFLTVEEYVKTDKSEKKSIYYLTEDKRLYINNGEKRYLVLKKIPQKTESETAITNKNLGHYKLGKGIYANRFIDTNFLVSNLLIFKFGEKTSGAKKWTKIYNIRNQKAAHPKSENVSIEDINLLLDFMIFFFNDNNSNWIDEDNALPDVSIQEEIELLKEKFGTN